MAQSPSDPTGQGFQGSIGSFPLVDLLQVWSMNGFSGLVSVTSRNRSCHLYFVEGDVVHAEMDGQVGEGPVRTILRWTDGAFELHPNTTTLHRTIEKKLSHLLLDAHREMDEMRRDAPPPRPAAPPPIPAKEPAPAATQPARDGAKRGILDQLRAIRGVTALARFGPDGRPVGEAGPEAEALAAKGLYLALTHGAAVAEAFGLRDLSVASLGGGPEQLVVIHSGDQFVALSVAPDAAIDSVVTQVRALFTRPAPRSR